MNAIDKNIINCIDKRHKTYWDFKNCNSKDSIYSPYSYPAKMVPAMQSELIDAILQNDNQIQNIFDPYMGSRNYSCRRFI